MYQVTDLGKSSYAMDSPAFSPDFEEREVRPVRIDDDGRVTYYDRKSLDSSMYGNVHAPYTVGSMELYPAPQDARYRVGYATSNDPRSYWQAVLWDGQTGRVLGQPPSPPGAPEGAYSVGLGVNDSGQVVGMAGNTSGPPSGHAISWGVLPDGGDPFDAVRSQLGSYSEAFGINNTDQIVGAFQSVVDPRAFLLQGGQLTDLNSVIPSDSGWTLLSATGINEQGQIVGYGIGPAGDLHRFLLTPDSGNSTPPSDPGTPSPVAEPTALTTLVIALGGMILRRQRRRDC
jgi:hypothetical protein